MTTRLSIYINQFLGLIFNSSSIFDSHRHKDSKLLPFSPQLWKSTYDSNIASAQLSMLKKIISFRSCLPNQIRFEVRLTKWEYQKNEAYNRRRERNLSSMFVLPPSIKLIHPFLSSLCTR